MHRIGITSFAYIPISAATSATEAQRLYQKAEAEVEKHKQALGNKIPPGLAEQWDLQLKTLKDDSLPDLEFIAFPGFFTAESEWITSTSYSWYHVLQVPTSIWVNKARLSQGRATLPYWSYSTIHSPEGPLRVVSGVTQNFEF